MSAENSPTMSPGQESNGPEQSSEKGGQKVKKGTIYDELLKIAESQRSETESEERIESSFVSYADYQADYYKRSNQERVDDAQADGHQRVRINVFGEDSAVTMIAQVKIDKDTGDVVDGHDYNPEAESMSEIEEAFRLYLEKTPPEERLVIFEGSPMRDEDMQDRDSAIRLRTDSGLVQHLADRSGVEAIPAEISNAQQADIMEAAGIPREASALFLALRSLSANYSDEEVSSDISMDLYQVLADLGIQGIEEIPEESKASYLASPAMMKALKDKVAPFVEQWNSLLVDSGLPTLVVSDDGSIKFTNPPDGSSVTYNELGSAISATGGTPLKDIAKINMREARDKVIFKTIVRATESGKRPFIVYGGSHVVSLEPVLQAHFGTRQQQELPKKS